MKWCLGFVAVVALASAGCRSLDLGEGKLPCSKTGGCPAPYVCWASDNKCHRHQMPSDGGADQIADTTGDKAADTAVDLNGETTEGGATKQPNGHACGEDVECANGFCRDGVCCNDTCAGAC